MNPANALLVVLVLCLTYNFFPTEGTHIIGKVTDFVQGEVNSVQDTLKVVQDKLKGAVAGAFHSVHELIHPHHTHPGNSQYHPHRPSTGGYSNNQGTQKPNYGAGQSSTVADEDVSYAIDVRNNENGLAGNYASTEGGINRNCPEGQHRDRAGRCRGINF